MGEFSFPRLIVSLAKSSFGSCTACLGFNLQDMALLSEKLWKLFNKLRQKAHESGTGYEIDGIRKEKERLTAAKKKKKKKKKYSALLRSASHMQSTRRPVCPC